MTQDYLAYWRRALRRYYGPGALTQAELAAEAREARAHHWRFLKRLGRHKRARFTPSSTRVNPAFVRAGLDEQLSPTRALELEREHGSLRAWRLVLADRLMYKVLSEENA